MKISWLAPAGFLLTLLTLGPLAGELRAQDAAVCDLGPGVGVGVPVGELDEVVDPGFAGGVAASCAVEGRLRIGGAVGLEVLPGDEADLLLVHLLIGPQIQFGSTREGSHVRVAAEIGWSNGEVTTPFDLGRAPRADLIRSSFTAGGRVRVGHAIGSSLGAFAEAGWRTLFVDAEAPLSTEEGFDEVTVLPFTVGLQIGL